MRRYSVVFSVGFLFTSLTLVAQTSQHITYNNLGRISGVTYLRGTDALRITYAYDDRGNITSTATEVVATVHEHDSTISIHISPNPASKQLNLNGTVAPFESVTIDVTDAIGRMIKTYFVKADANGRITMNTDLDRTNFSDGLYFVCVRSSTATRTAKFIITA